MQPSWGPGAAVEWVELRVAWEIPAPTWTFPESVGNGVQQSRQVTLWETHGSEGEPTAVNADAYDRSDLPLDFQFEGPAIVIEEDATTYIPSGWIAHTAKGGYIRIRKNG